MRRTIPLAEAKHKLSAIVQKVNESYEQVVIIKNETDAAVLLSADEYEGLLETLDLRSHPDEEQVILRAKKQARKGQTVALSTMKKKTGTLVNYAVRFTRELEHGIAHK